MHARSSPRQWWSARFHNLHEGGLGGRGVHQNTPHIGSECPAVPNVDSRGGGRCHVDEGGRSGEGVGRGRRGTDLETATEPGGLF